VGYTDDIEKRIAEHQVEAERKLKISHAKKRRY